MADQVIRVGLNVSDLQSGAAAAARIFAQQNQLVGNLAVQYINLNRAAQQTAFGLQGVNRAGQVVTTTFRNVNNQFQATNTHISALTRNVTTLGQQAKKAGEIWTLSWKGVVRLIEALTIRRLFSLLTQGILQSVDAVIQFQKAVGEIGTIAGRSGLSFQQLSDRVFDLAAQFNRTPIDVARATYEAFSNQIIQTAADFSFLSESLRFARITVSSTEDSVNLLSSAINAFGFATFETKRIADTFFAGIDIGRFRAQDLANTFGRVAVTASQVGVSFEETTAFLSLVTRQGIKAAEAETQLSSVLVGLLKPTPELTALFADLGFASTQAAIDIVGLSGVFNILEREMARGGERLGELAPNVRAMRGIFAATADGGDQLSKELLKLAEAAGEADKALAKIREAPGEQLQEQFNKLQIFFQKDFGNLIVDSLLKLGEPFGGIDKLVKELTNTLVTVVKAIFQIGQTVSQTLAFFNQFGLTISRLASAFTTYLVIIGAVRLATFAITPLINLASAAYIRLAVVLNPTIANIQRYNLAMAANAAASANAAAAAGGATARFASMATTFVGLAVIGVFVFTSIADAIEQSTSKAQEFSDLQESIARNNERFGREAREQQERSLTSFRRRTDVTFDVFGRVIQGAIVALQELDTEQKRVLQATTEEFERATNRVKESQDELINSLRQGIRDSAREIERAAVQARKFSDDLRRTIFDQRLSSFGFTSQQAGRLSPQEIRNLQIQQAFANRVTEGQINTIQNRIQQLQSEAQDLFRQGTRDSGVAARERFAEIETLTRRQFELEEEQRRRSIENAARIAASQTGQTQFRIFVSQTQELERRLQDVQNERNDGEREFTTIQQEANRNASRQLEIEENRRDLINQAIEALKKFTVLDEQGNIRRELRSDTGDLNQTRSNARQALTEATTAAQNAIGIVSLTIEEQLRLQQTLGRDATLQILESINQRSLSERQALDLERVLGSDRARLLEENLRAQRAIGAQRVALEAQVNREIAIGEFRRLEESRRAAEQSLNQQRQAAQTAQEEQRARQETLLETTTRTTQQLASLFAAEQRARLFGQGDRRSAEEINAQFRLKQAIDDTLAAQQALNRERTPENIDALRINLQRLGEREQDLSRLRVDPNSENSNQLRRLGEEARSAATSLRLSNEAAIAAANQIAITEARMNSLEIGISGLIRTLPEELQVAALTFTRIGDQMANAFQGVAQELRNLIELMKTMQGIRLSPSLPTNPPLNLPGGATGGLFGGKFNTSGPDNMIAAVRSGEFILNPTATRRFYPQLVAMNKGRIPSFEKGGIVNSNVTVGDIIVNESASPTKTGRAVMREISREMRRRGKK